MEHKRLIIGLLVIVLVAGVAGVSASMPDVSSAHSIAPVGHRRLPSETASLNVQASAERDLSQSQDAPEVLLATPGWQQVNSNGFGDLNAGEISAVEAFNGYLYAGTHNPINDARIFRSPDGVTWTPVTDPGFGDPHDIAPPAILDMTVFNSRLYAGTGRGNASQLWRTSNGTIWAPMDKTGFSDPDNVAITALAEYGSKIYAGVTNDVTGAQIWSSFTGDNNSWTQVGPESPGSAPASVTALTVFSNTLYAAIEPESDAPLQIWRSYGGEVWTTVIDDGFGDNDNTKTGGMAVFDGYLYLGVGNATSHAQLWRSIDGDNWATAITSAFGDPNNVKVETVYVFQNQLYAGVKNTVTGIEIWRSSNGTLWEQVNQDGFGDSDNNTSNGSNATASFLDQLYVGTSNTVDGGELWRMKLPFDVNLSPNDTLTGTAGQSITYNLWITNTGTMTDTFDLAASTSSWATAVSTSTVSLTPGASEQFSVTVDIPNNAMGSDSDMVSITATSQGDPTKSDSAQLTTTVTANYGVQLSPDDALDGVPGGTVVYTLQITNTGNAADTFDLAIAGNGWATVLSSSSVALPSGTSGTFKATVTIPADALGNAADAVTVTATSQGDNLAKDSAVLTTTCIDLNQKLYLPLILRNP